MDLSHGQEIRGNNVKAPGISCQHVNKPLHLACSENGQHHKTRVKSPIHQGKPQRQALAEKKQAWWACTSRGFCAKCWWHIDSGYVLWLGHLRIGIYGLKPWRGSIRWKAFFKTFQWVGWHLIFRFSLYFIIPHVLEWQQDRVCQDTNSADIVLNF